MNNVTLNMIDLMTSNKVTRTIDITNAMSTGGQTWELKDEQNQRANLEQWINERGNQQHETTLLLESWSFS
jgi:hypothetical protein